MRNKRSSVDAFLAQPALALVGASRSGEKFGNVILRQLREKGMKVYPIHPLTEMIDGVQCYARFADIPEPVGGVIISVPPSDAVSVIRDAADAGVKHIWLQQGAESPYLADLCKELGLDAVIDECILMHANPTGIHRVHRAVEAMLGRLPK